MKKIIECIKINWKILKFYATLWKIINIILKNFKSIKTVIVIKLKKLKINLIINRIKLIVKIIWKIKTNRTIIIKLVCL